MKGNKFLKTFALLTGVTSFATILLKDKISEKFKKNKGDEKLNSTNTDNEKEMIDGEFEKVLIQEILESKLNFNKIQKLGFVHDGDKYIFSTVRDFSINFLVSLGLDETDTGYFSFLINKADYLSLNENKMKYFIEILPEIYFNLSGGGTYLFEKIFKIMENKNIDHNKIIFFIKKRRD